jgi:hypothetical protein
MLTYVRVKNAQYQFSIRSLPAREAHARGPQGTHHSRCPRTLLSSSSVAAHMLADVFFLFFFFFN